MRPLRSCVPREAPTTIVGRRRFDPVLYKELIHYPTEIIPIFDLVLHNIIKDKYPDANRVTRTQVRRQPSRLQLCWRSLPRPAGRQVRMFNLMKTHRMRELDPQDIDKMVAIKGMVIRVSKLMPDLRAAFFQCSACNNKIEVQPSAALGAIVPAGWLRHTRWSCARVDSAGSRPHH
jgi:DNA replicative helicase MCM subunit Mcm2 (Cdc46/Mcm family)